MKHLVLFEKFYGAQPELLYHFTRNERLAGILRDGNLCGSEGVVWDEEDGATISTTTNPRYNELGHDIVGECRLTFLAERLAQDFDCYEEEDEGYVEMRAAELVKAGVAPDAAAEQAREHQVIIKTDALDTAYIERVDFFVAPEPALQDMLRAANIPFGSL